jgi:hypothetical protein
LGGGVGQGGGVVPQCNLDTEHDQDQEHWKYQDGLKGGGA